MPEAGDTPEPATDFDAFWAFAGALWANPAARERLMHWQDGFDVDVMLVSFALWYPHPLGASQWHALRQTAHHWNTSRTARIRALRRRLYTPDRNPLYRAMLGLELQSERLAALQLHTHASHLHGQVDGAAVIDPERRLRSLFPDLPDTEIRDGLREFTSA
ncbi:DUF2390 domain-containing protein [Thioalkalivibrio sp. AKL19]|uniref:DUF2390 domain-containing protein n=1 Tax=Thioalkalivibrio sp. AKL19 TaxID=1266914 RepID=UPI0004294381|nr:DUF2390 domain-containing protein [Thioalkalivibrio sp. AKL19]